MSGYCGENYFLSKESRLIHLAQAKILLPAKGLYFFSLMSEGTLSHWRLGYFLVLGEGLYFPLSLFNFRAITVPFPQIKHCLDILEDVSKIILKK